MGIDMEYSQKLAAARTDCSGREIIGVWVAQLKDGFGGWAVSKKMVLLIRPSGTGIWRLNNLNWPVTWTYAGSGVWQGEASLHGLTRSLTMRYNGTELLLRQWDVAFDSNVNKFGITAAESSLTIKLNIVFVAAEDETAIDEHLRVRR